MNNVRSIVVTSRDVVMKSRGVLMRSRGVLMTSRGVVVTSRVVVMTSGDVNYLLIKQDRLSSSRRNTVYVVGGDRDDQE